MGCVLWAVRCLLWAVCCAVCCMLCAVHSPTLPPSLTSTLSNLSICLSLCLSLLTVTLRNDGDKAYQPERFGNKICVQRTITKTSSGGSGGGMKLLGIPSSSSSSGVGGEAKPRWEVVNATGTKELKNILKHFAIEVENPCCVLTQEYSKKFIQGKEDAKYDFFFKATGLEAMKEEFSRFSDKLDVLKDKITNFEETLKGKKAARNKLRQELEELMGFERLEAEIAAILCKTYWLEELEAKELIDALREKVDEMQEVRFAEVGWLCFDSFHYGPDISIILYYDYYFLSC